MTPPIIVEAELEQVLSQLAQKFDHLQHDINDLKIGQAQLAAELAGNRAEITDLKEVVKSLHNTQKAQIWSLVWTLTWTVIGVLSLVIVTCLVRFVIMDFLIKPLSPNP
jgi:CRISPR/Cas system-associated protein Cas10 (large subunit of type III CRISPR-Cas system)